MKNVDGIEKPKNISVRVKPGFAGPRFVKVDSIVRRPSRHFIAKTRVSTFFVVPKTPTAKQLLPVLSSTFRNTPQLATGMNGLTVFLRGAIPRRKVLDLFFKKLYSQKKVPVLAAVAALVLAFGAGMWSALDTKSSIANSEPAVLAAVTDRPSAPSAAEQNNPPAGTPVAGPQLQGQDSGVSNDVLFNTPIEYLQNYFKSISEPDVIFRRKTRLEQFLAEMRSPLAPAAETIALQEHWKLILAITFAESTLGKNCANHNCSNIGVKPGAPSWRSYASYSAWLVDFNRLLDKKYNDWTLEEMCGVYVKPCNPNWLLATKQILTALKEKNIE